MASRESINMFFNSKNIAVVGVSGTGKGMGYSVYQKLRQTGFNVFPVNNHVDNIDGNKCYNSISELQGKADAVIMVIPPSEGRDVVTEAEKTGIRNIWFQPGSESRELIDFAESLKLNVVRNECIMMYTEPVGGMHRFHRVVNKITGRYPK